MIYSLFKRVFSFYRVPVKYPVFAILAFGVFAGGCFNPKIKNGGFACDPSTGSACPAGFYCVNKLCVDSPLGNGGNGGGGGGGSGGSQDLSMPDNTVADMAKMSTMQDLAMAPGPDLAMPPGPDMSKPVNTCSHSPCSSGGLLDQNCSSCVNMFCNDSRLNGGDSYCCSVAWDSTCVKEYKLYCPGQC
jgi:hypothetical protein